MFAHKVSVVGVNTLAESCMILMKRLITCSMSVVTFSSRSNFVSV